MRCGGGGAGERGGAGGDARRGSARVQVLSGPLGDRRVPQRDRGGSRSGDAGAGAAGGVIGGGIDTVESDHARWLPSLKAMDSGDYAAAWGGISSLQLALPAVWTQARGRGVAVAQVARWMCERPAALAGMGKRKGKI